MFGKILSRLVGYDRYKQRGDRFFLESDFNRALHEYRRARTALSSTDYRTATLNALIRECSLRIGDAAQTEETLDEATSHFVPGLEDLFELAIADKSPDRLKRYRELGKDFEAGYVALVQGDADGAIRHLQNAALKNPACFILQLELGRALSLAGQMESAHFELQEAIRLQPSDAETLNLLAAVDIQLGRFDEAAHLLEPLLQKEEIGPETHFLLGRCLAGLGKKDEALERFRETVKLDSLFHEAFYEGAVLLRQEGKIESAVPLLSRACSIAPDEVRYNRELVELVLEHELDEEMGLAACDRLMVTDEASRWLYLSWIAELYLRRGWRREACDPLRKALKLVPPDRTEERLDLERQLAELADQELR